MSKCLVEFLDMNVPVNKFNNEFLQNLKRYGHVIIGDNNNGVITHLDIILNETSYTIFVGVLCKYAQKMHCNMIATFVNSNT